MEPDAVDEEGLVSPAEMTAEEKKKGKKVDGQEEVQSEDQPAGGDAETEKEPERTDADASLLASGHKKKRLWKKLRQRIQKKETQKHRAEWRHMEESKMAKIHKCRRNELLFSFGRGRRKCDEGV
ncbi:hypothetical protein CgunFtcFv8_026650 [Champsocephalus gunnari]|uniref:Uncharacterized protein n=1 Tax=Champsocephalus gunnari TaxID=52237 RepID=A0AAN8I0N8_CHAGU|nr:hypothetical protein CgunFtcFv8_026650 [Champsocephalus gunnari]